jgi:hypothetical protein
MRCSVVFSCKFKKLFFVFSADGRQDDPSFFLENMVRAGVTFLSSNKYAEPILQLGCGSCLQEGICSAGGNNDFLLSSAR